MSEFNEQPQTDAQQGAVDPLLLLQQKQDQIANEIKGATQQTSAAQFRKDTQTRKDGELITLSSGHVLRIARPSINGLMKTGQLPTELSNAAIKMQQSDGNKPISADEMKKYVEYNERIISLSVVSPRIVDNPNYDNDEISIDDLADDERTEVLQYVQGGLDALIKFRTER
jgi:hypothetical protein